MQQKEEILTPESFSGDYSKALSETSDYRRDFGTFLHYEQYQITKTKRYSSKTSKGSQIVKLLKEVNNSSLNVTLSSEHWGRKS